MATSTVLGCPQSYNALVTRRGGGSPVGVLENVESFQWDRKLNAMGEAVVTMAAGQISSQCCRLMNLLAQDESMRAYELHIYRDNDAVWCGPIWKVGETRGTNQDQFVLSARDILAYLDCHYLQAGYNATADVVELAVQVIGADLVSDDPSIGANLVITDAGIVVSRAAARASGSVLAELGVLVASGLRFTTAVRSLYLGGLRGTAFGAPIRLSVDQIAGDVTVEHDGSQFYNTVYGRSGTASSQIPGAGAPPPDDPLLVTIGGPEPAWRGRIETGVSAVSGISGATSVAAAAQAAYFTAQRPRVLRVADNSVISPSATVTVPALVCGSVVKIAGQGRFCTWVDQDLQLVRVSGSYGSDGEKIGISLGPVG